MSRYHAGIGYGSRDYGSFDGKEATTPAAEAITIYRIGFGFGGQRYVLANFDGKEQASAITAIDNYPVFRRRRRRGGS